MAFNEKKMDYNGGCVIPLRALRTGYRVFPLVDEHGDNITGSHVFCEVRWHSLEEAAKWIHEHSAEKGATEGSAGGADGDGAGSEGSDSEQDLLHRFDKLASVMKHGGLYSRQMNALEDASSIGLPDLGWHGAKTNKFMRHL
jgi:hypothetical protein